MYGLLATNNPHSRGGFVWVRNTKPFFELYSAFIYFPSFLLSLALVRSYTWKSATIGHFLGEKLEKNEKTNLFHLPSFLIWGSRGVLVFVIFLPCTIEHRNPKFLHVFSTVIKLGGDYGQFPWKYGIKRTSMNHRCNSLLMDPISRRSFYLELITS